ncbi:hypothetical protein BC941DRAFT_420429 [Chlamydoabsidia padenii]|nr:hypothetical protein BC941DRAFT_420429 [Chlamydoabsidia padenii]
MDPNLLFDMVWFSYTGTDNPFIVVGIPSLNPDGNLVMPAIREYLMLFGVVADQWKYLQLTPHPVLSIGMSTRLLCD